MFGEATQNLIEDCIFSNNTSDNAGGAIYLFMPGDLLITRCIFGKNYALDGSAIYYEEKDLKKLIVNSSLFYENIADSNGAALFIFRSSKAIIDKCNFSNNLIKPNLQNLGSVIFLNNPGDIWIINSQFMNNVGILGTCISYSETS